MIISVQMDFSVLPRCKGNEIDLFGILDKIKRIFSLEVISVLEMETINNALQCIITEKSNAESLWSA